MNRSKRLIWGDYMSILTINSLHTYIDQFHILQGVSIEVKKGDVTVILGRNGAGKTTTMRSIIGLTPGKSGEILFQGKNIMGLPAYEVAKTGIGYVPEDQGIFGDLTVEENMRVAMRKEDQETMKRQEWMLEIFPDLKKAWTRKGGNLSGGQKQMLSIARALVNDNPLLLIDEPSKGLAPIMVEKVMEALQVIKEKTTVLLVEQNFMMASLVGDSFYIIDDGRTVYDGTMEQLKDNEELKRKYLGIA